MNRSFRSKRVQVSLLSLFLVLLGFFVFYPATLRADDVAASGSSEEVMSSSSQNRFNYESKFFPITNPDNSLTRIHYNRWYQDDARGIVIEVSGLQSHTMWFVNMGEMFYSSGYNVYSMDRRGAGMSDGRRGDVANYQVWIDDLEAIVQLAQRENPGLPVHLLANCFGTRIALGLAIQEPGLVSSLILTAPATHMRVGFDLLKKIRIAATPGAYLSTPLRDEMFTTNPTFLNYMKNDSLALRKATGRLFRESQSLNDFVMANLHALQTPVLSLLSMSDRVINADLVIKEFHNKLPNPNSKLVVYQDAAHYLLFESVWSDAMNNMKAWLGGF